ncbi:carbohydrate ABC transporter permease [Nesterenkonia flava]|uniref:Sugar ABC transporter permease n=1 Tax=Nesterenkonia flava TaxID=469799 RepID=A0ABU1FQU0_9MICC|nr:sugar ABC transporter permease [Nesterenkonia flava]MDR5710974.1 sugar ABC transporter permease [Nesterenkonia flava]
MTAATDLRAETPTPHDRGSESAGAAAALKRRRRADALFSYAALTPAFVILIGFTVLPFILSAWRSLQTNQGEFTTANYERMLSDSVFHQVIQNQLVYTAVTVPATIGVSLGLAVLGAKVVRAKALARVAFLAPTVLPIVAAGTIWVYFYQPNFGVLNGIAGFLGLPELNWLGISTTALPAMMVVAVWQQAGLFVIFYLAALLTQDPQLREAARVEGTKPWTFFRRVTWPLLMPTTLFVGVVATANSFKQVDLIFVMTQGGPHDSTNLMLYYVWQTAFGQFRPEYSAAITVMLVLILLLVAIVQIRLLDKRIHYR